MNCSFKWYLALYILLIIAWRPNYTSDKERRSCIPITVHCSSINGLLCLSLDPLGVNLSHWFETCLWNPTINELRRLPSSPLDLSEDRSEWEPFYGFGYDSTNDDYVVVRLITRFTRFSDQAYRIKVELYSLKHDSWRLIQPFPYHVIFHQRTYLNCHFVNNRFHWMVYCETGYESPNRWMIVSLDLSNDEYRDISFIRKTRKFSSLGLVVKQEVEIEEEVLFIQSP